MKIEGDIWKFGDHIDTDLIIPARYLNVSDQTELARHCFADLRPEFAGTVKRGDILVGGKNFGCGSSREHAPRAIKACGVGAVVAGSFARIFYRNAFNIGLPILECEEAVDGVEEGHRVSVDLSTGKIVDYSNSRTFTARPVPEFMQAIVRSGGLVAYTKEQLGPGPTSRPYKGR